MKYFVYDIKNEEFIFTTTSFKDKIFPDLVFPGWHNFNYCVPNSTYYTPYMIYLEKYKYIRLAFGKNYHIRLNELAHCINDYQKNKLKRFIIIDSFDRVIHADVFRNIFIENYNNGYYNDRFYNKISQNMIFNKRKRNYIKAINANQEGNEIKFYSNYWKCDKLTYSFRNDSVPGIRHSKNYHHFRKVRTLNELKNVFDEKDLNSQLDEFIKDDSLLEWSDDSEIIEKEYNYEDYNIKTSPNFKIVVNKRIARKRNIPTYWDDVYIHNEKNWKRNSKARKSWGKHILKGRVKNIEYSDIEL
ncbi:MAG: hypothetical protein PHT94_01035 [Candidatus Nanoarchaeia archaeon]|nr:hypothetical protein [Candidatus Nanoarchaeia archaeon]